MSAPRGKAHAVFDFVATVTMSTGGYRRPACMLMGLRRDAHAENGLVITIVAGNKKPRDRQAMLLLALSAACADSSRLGAQNTTAMIA